MKITSKIINIIRSPKIETFCCKQMEEAYKSNQIELTNEQALIRLPYQEKQMITYSQTEQELSCIIMKELEQLKCEYQRSNRWTDPYTNRNFDCNDVMAVIEKYTYRILKKLSKVKVETIVECPMNKEVPTRELKFCPFCGALIEYARQEVKDYKE